MIHNTKVILLIAFLALIKTSTALPPVDVDLPWKDPEYCVCGKGFVMVRRVPCLCRAIVIKTPVAIPKPIPIPIPVLTLGN